MPADIEFATPPFYAFFSSYGANGEYYGDRAYSAQSFAQVFIKFFKTGVIGADAHQTPSTTFQPLQIMARERLQFTIKAGAAWIDGHVGEVFDGTVGTLENADGVYNRIDRVVMRLYGGDGKDERKLVPHIITGTPAANPAPPPLVRDGTDYDLSLATILVPAGATAITQANITDTRFDLDVCGFVRLAFELPMDTTDLFAQFSAVFHEFMAQLEETMGENVATNLLNLINAQTERLTDYEEKTDTKISTLESTSASHTSTLSSHSTIISRLNKKRVEKILTINSGTIGNKEVIYTPLKPFSEFAMLILYVGGSATNYYRYTGTPSYTETITIKVSEAVPLTYLVERLGSNDQSLLIYGEYEQYNQYGDGKTIKIDGFLNFYAGSSNATISMNNIKVSNKSYSYNSGNINAKITVYGVR